MAVSASIPAEFIRQNRRTLSWYLGTMLLVAVGVASYLVWREKYIVLFVIIAIPVTVFFLTRTDWAVYQFVFFIFFSPVVFKEIPLMVGDLSAVMVVLAACLDLLLESNLPRRFPPLFVNLMLLFVVVGVAAVFGHNPIAAVNPLGRIALLTLTFLSLYRLSSKVNIRQILNLFFWLATLHSFMVLIQFVAAGGGIRSFGLAPHKFDDLALLALSVGAALYLWTPGVRAIAYGVATTVVFGALVATQSRLSILFGILMLGCITVVSVVRMRQMNKSGHLGEQYPSPASASTYVKYRIGTLVIVMLGAAGLAVVVAPEILAAVLERFDQILTYRPSGTFRTRLELWQTALLAFEHNPVLGIGPGTFRTVSEIFPSLHLTNYYLWVKGLSAHNLFLHYLAETGLIGAAVLVSLFANEFRLGRLIWKRHRSDSFTPYALALYMVSLLFFITIFIEAGWLWGQLGFAMALFFSLIARQHCLNRK